MKIKNFIFLITALALGAPTTALAENSGDILDRITNTLHPVASLYNQPDQTGQNTTAWLVARVGAVMQVFLSLLGIMMILLLLYGGYLWMTARGNEQQVEDAQHTIRSAIFGAIVIIASAAITMTVLNKIGGALTN